MSLALLAVFAPESGAQTDDQGGTGIKSGNYNVQESIEVGYRKDFIIGNPDTFDTFVDLNTGLRLVDYNLSMRSVNNQGILFDNLTFSNFGYGGDPEDVSRLRVNKNKYYDFSLVFRRDKNFWDYNLLDNPLNPNWSLAQAGGTTILGTALNSVANAGAITAGLNAGMMPSIGVGNSPHSLYLVRRMQDYDLTLLPESKVRLRLGYSRNVNEGPSLTSFAGSTVGVTNFSFPLEQNVRLTTNSYRMGADFRVLPKTTISYDQFLEYNKNDTSDTLANTPYLAQVPGIAAAVPASLPVAIGLAFYYPPVNSGTPCGFGNTAPTAGFPVPVSNPSGLVPPFPYGDAVQVNPYCKMASSYVRTAPARNFVPTERLSFQSKYFKRLEMSGSASYNSSRSTVANLYDSANEWANPALNAATGDIRDVITSGSSAARQVAARANWTGIVTLTDKIRIVDTVNYDNWRTSGNFNQTNTTLFGNATNYYAAGIPLGIFQPIANFAVGAATGPAFSAICPAPYTAATCPQHNFSTGTSSAVPDAYSTFNYDFLGQRRISNSAQLEADLTNRISGRIGYYYDQRLISETPWNALYPANAVEPNMGAYYYPGGTNGTAANYYNAARGVCALVGGVLPSNCVLQSDGSIKYSPTLVGSTDPTGYCMEGTQAAPAFNVDQVFMGRCKTLIHEQTGLAGFTLRPMDNLRIYSDFQFGYNDAAYVRTAPRQVQSYKVHANYKPRTWLTIDGSMDIHENRDNVAEINNTEHGRTFGFNTMFSRTENLILNLGYNYTNLSVQEIIAFRDNFEASTSIAGDALNTTNYSSYLTGIFAGGTAIGYLNYNPANSVCPQTMPSAPGDNTGATVPAPNANINLCTNAFYNSHQHYAYGDVLWKPMKRVTADFGYTSTFIGGSTIFPNPLQPAGTLAYNFQKPSASLEINLYKGLSYKTYWNYYAYQSRAPVIASVTLPAGGPYAGMTYALAPIPAPDFRGSTLMFAMRYAF